MPLSMFRRRVQPFSKPQRKSKGYLSTMSYYASVTAMIVSRACPSVSTVLQYFLLVLHGKSFLLPRQTERTPIPDVQDTIHCLDLDQVLLVPRRVPRFRHQEFCAFTKFDRMIKHIWRDIYTIGPHHSATTILRFSAAAGDKYYTRFFTPNKYIAVVSIIRFVTCSRLQYQALTQFNALVWNVSDELQ